MSTPRFDTSTETSTVSVTIDGATVDVAAGTTLRQACEELGSAPPTICWGENLTPVSACRLCVVELEGSRTLVPSCSREVDDGMVVHSNSDRVRHSRRMVLEFLATSSDLSEAPELLAWMDEYDADPSRYPAGTRIDEPVRQQDDLYVRDYDKCVLCFKCVDVCGEEAQHTFAITVAHRGFDSRISTEFDAQLPDSACVYCGNCVAVCPTNALQFTTEFDLRAAADWRPEDQDVTTTVCSYCGVGCNLELHTQDERIVKVTSPADHDVTLGNLCIKGRFGWQYVQGPTRQP